MMDVAAAGVRENLDRSAVSVVLGRNQLSMASATFAMSNCTNTSSQKAAA